MVLYQMNTNLLISAIMHFCLFIAFLVQFSLWFDASAFQSLLKVYLQKCLHTHASYLLKRKWSTFYFHCDVIGQGQSSIPTTFIKFNMNSYGNVLYKFHTTKFNILAQLQPLLNCVAMLCYKMRIFWMLKIKCHLNINLMLLFLNFHNIL